MAVTPRTRFSNLLNTIGGRFTSAQLKSVNPTVYAPSKNLLTDDQRDKLLGIAYKSDAVPPQTGTSALEYFQKLSKQLASERIENDRIIQMAPEISLAASIMIPSIMAPNDFREDKIPITCNVDTLTADTKAKITELVTDYFEDKFHFSTSVPKWIYEAMYRSGAKPLLVVPLTELYKKMTDPGSVVGAATLGSTESFKSAMESLDKKSLYGIGDDTSDSIDKTVSATESFGIGAIEEILGVTEPTRHDRAKALSAYQKFAKDVLSTERLSVSDNPDSINLSARRNKQATGKIKNRVKNAYGKGKPAKNKTGIAYKEAPFQTFEVPDADTDPVGEPVFMELPTESVIPIYTPGTPGDHLGYFIILDEYGHPINVMDYTKTSYMSAGDAPTQTNFSQMFSAYGYDISDSNDAQRNQNTVASIYQYIVEAHLKSRVENAGFNNVDLGSNSSIYRCLFTRYLQQRKTRILFIPKELMTYFCFKHSENGTGVSKLDELKFILSLRISLLVSRMLSAFRNALDRKVINLNFSENFVGNPLEVMRTAERESVRKDAITFSSNPTDIAQQIADKSYTVKVTGIAGLPEFSVGKEPDERSASVAPPDEQLADDIKNMEILGLEVPPAAMNSLNDAEFSRSVATTNIIFSRKLVGYQNLVEHYVDMFVKSYATYDEGLRKEIQDLINGSDGDRPTDKGTAVEKKNAADVDEVIESLHFTLPSPNIAPDSTQFESLSSMISALGTITDILMDDSLAGDDPGQRAVFAAYKAISRADVVKQYIQKIGFTDIEFPNVEHVDSDALFRIRQILQNIAKGYKDQDAVLAPGTGDDSQTPDAFSDTNTDDTSDFGAVGDDGMSDDTGTPDDTSDDGTTPDDTGADTTDTTDTSTDTTTPPTSSTGTDTTQADGPTGASLV